MIAIKSLRVLTLEVEQYPISLWSPEVLQIIKDIVTSYRGISRNCPLVVQLGTSWAEIELCS
jgi:hypothetical protein